MKRKILKSVLLFSVMSFISNAQNPDWTKHMGSLNIDHGNSLTVDRDGNVFITGIFLDTADLDPGTGIFNLISTGSFDIYISKLDSAGNFIWAKQLGGIYLDNVSSIASDIEGNVYIGGFFAGVVDFDPGPAVFNLSAVGVYNSFVLKLDSSGNFVWAKQFNSMLENHCSSLALDSSRNVYTTGYFKGVVDFDPGAGTFNLTTGFDDAFVSKLDSNGNFVWARQLGGSLYDNGTAITIDRAGNIYITGTFGLVADFDPGPGVFNLNSFGNNDIFISKLDSSGNFIWARQLGGIATEGSSSITTDNNGNVYTTGFFQGLADFDPGIGVSTLGTVGLNDIFISKLDSSGNFGWVKQWGGIKHDHSSSIAVDSIGNVYTYGTFTDTLYFDPVFSTYNLISSGNYNDVFISKLDPSGNLVWSKQLKGSSLSTALVLDPMGNIYGAGDFGDTLDFNTGSNTFNLISTGSTDAYVFKLGQPISGINNLSVDNEVLIYPNPGSGQIFINAGKRQIQNLKLININGQMISHKKNIFSPFFQLQINQGAGAYFLEIETEGKLNYYKIIQF